MRCIIKGKRVEARVVERLSLQTQWSGRNIRPYDVEYDGRTYRVWDDEGDGRLLPNTSLEAVMERRGRRSAARGDQPEAP